MGGREDSPSRLYGVERGGPKKAPKILIAEDDAFCRDAMERLLQSSGYETLSCSCGKEALACLEKEKFDFLITDFRKPEMDGLELIGKARAMDPALAMILVTGIPPEDLGDQLKESRVNGFLSKPLGWQNLIFLLKSLGERSAIK